MNFFITGAAGFIGSSAADRLLRDGHRIVGYDNFSTGQERFIQDALACSGGVEGGSAGGSETRPYDRPYKRPDERPFDRPYTMIRGDTLDLPALTAAMQGADFVLHLAANADVRFGVEHPRKDLEQNTIATFNVLEAMRANGVKRIGFSSTGSVYGEAPVIPTPEDAPFPVQTSLYGASKLAGEGLIAAYCEGFGFEGYIFRFVSILGERYTHGHVFDFYRSLRQDPTQLRVLGNGRQRKSYLYVQDCLDAILTAIEQAHERVNIFNLGADEYCEVNDSIGWICGHLGLQPRLNYTGGERGWIGDNPFIFLDCSKIRALGWKPKLTIQQGIIRTLEYLQANPWVLEARS